MGLDPALYLDHRQARAVVTFFEHYRVRPGVTFRLMPDVFEDSLDLTAYDEDGHEINHIHPRGERFLRPGKPSA